MRIDHPFLRLRILRDALLTAGRDAVRIALRFARLISHREALREAVLLWRWRQLDRRLRRHARRVIRQTRRRYPWALNLEASIASPIGMGNDGQRAYDLATRTWFGTLIGTLIAAGSPVFDVTAPQYLGGAKGDGITNDAPAIAAADAAAEPVNGIVFFPPVKGASAGYLVTASSGSEIFRIRHPVYWQGTGARSTLLVATGTAGTIDVIHVDPATATTTDASMYHFADFRIVPQSGVPARHAFRFEPTVANAFIRQSQIERCWTGILGGNSFSLANTGASANGAMFGCQLEDNFFSGGLDFSGGGDSLSVVRNTICNVADGTDAGAITVNLVAGAGQFVFEGNNFTGAGGFQLLSGIGTRIHANNMQLIYAGSGPNAAFINIVGGGLAGVTTTTITNNILTVLAGGGAYDPLRLNTTNNWIDGNYLLAQAGRTNLVITATGALTFIGYGNSYNGAAAAISDNGPSTFSIGPTGIITTPAGITFAGNNPRIRVGVADLGFLDHAGAVQLMLLSNAGDLSILRGVAFWNHAVVAAQPAAPVTLADVIAIIRGCGLSA